MKWRDVVALSAPAILWCGVMAVGIILFCLPTWACLFSIALLLLFNRHFKCFAYKGLYNKNVKVHVGSFTLITYNVNLAYKELSTQDKAERIAAYLLKCNADIVLLQEYNPNLFPVLHQNLSVVYPYGSPFEKADRYKAIYSKYPISDFVQLTDHEDVGQNMACDGDENRRFLPICGMKVGFDGHEVYIVNCHLHSNNFSPALRSFKQGYLTAFGLLKESIKHLNDGILIRERQINSLVLHLKAIRLPILICGDLNDVCGAKSFRRLEKISLKDTWWEKGIGFGSTVKVLWMRWRLDHVLCTNDIEIEKVRIGKKDLSDHKPLICMFNLIL